MKAIVLEGTSHKNEFKLKEIPTPIPQEGEVRIQVKSAGFNPVDFKIRKGAYGGTLPMILGADCSGIIDAIGPNVSSFAVGDEVYALAFGRCSNGTYAEQVSLPTQFVAKKPRNLSFEEAASIPLAASTAYRSMIASGALAKPGPIFIAGAAGGVGSFGVELARHFHDGPIYTIAGSEESSNSMIKNLQIKKRNIIPYKGRTIEQLQNQFITLNQDQLFAATFDFVGKEMKNLCIALATHGGHVVTTCPEETSFSLPVWTRGVSPCFAKNLSLHFIFVGAEAFSGTPDAWQIYEYHLAEIAQLLESKAIKAPPLEIVGSLSTKTVEEAHRLLEEGHVKGKLVMQVC